MRVAAEGLFLLNAGMNLVSLWLPTRLIRTLPARPTRLLGAACCAAAQAVAGAVFPALGSFPAVLAGGALMAMIAYYDGSLRRAVCGGAYALLFALLLGGAGSYAASQLGSPTLALVLTVPAVGAAAGGVCLLPRAARRVAFVEIVRGDRAVMLPAMEDTGNLLRDPVTGLPVIVASRRALSPLLPDVPFPPSGAEKSGALPSDALPDTLPEGFRLLCVRTAGGRSLLPCFRPDTTRLKLPEGFRSVQAVVAVAPLCYQGVQALVPSDMV